MLGLSIGLRALIANELALNIAGNNIANASTPGYSRRDVLFSPVAGVDSFGSFSSGGGVEAREVRRLVDDLLSSRLRGQSQVLGRLDLRSKWLRDVESAFGEPGEGGVSALLDGFFAKLSAASARPDDSEARFAVVGAAVSLTESINLVANRLDSLRLQASQALAAKVGELNGLAERIAQLNGTISTLVGTGQKPHALLDERDRALAELSRLVDTRVISERDGSVTVLVGGRLLVARGRASDLESVEGTNGTASLALSGSTRPLNPQGGELQALLEIASGTIPETRAALDDLASELAFEVNRIHTTGVPSSGAFSRLEAAFSVARPSAPLRSSTPFPIAAGDLYVAVTDTSTGAIVRSRIAIDPDTTTLEGLAAALDAISRLDASIDGSGRLQIRAESGYSFDFSRRLDRDPLDSGAFGDVAVALDGAYTGVKNDRFRFVAEGDGEVGVTPGLRVRVLDAGGSTVALLDVGEGYSPGSFLDAGRGLSVSFGPGSISATSGDEFSTDVLSDPDETGVLAALGLNSFFAGSTATDLAVAASVRSAPAQFASSDAGEPGDNSNSARLARLGDESLESLGFASLPRYFASVVSGVGFEVRRAEQLRESQEALLTTLEERRDEVSGVSIDEEAANLIQFQRNYQAAARYIQVVNEALDELIALVR